MIRDLTIDGFRGFKHYEMHGLGRVNLLVGANNSGKTSVLEAVELLMAEGNPCAIAGITLRRGEASVVATPPHQMVENASETSTAIDVSHMFYGHEVEVDSKFELAATGQEGTVELTLQIVRQDKRPEFAHDFLDVHWRGPSFDGLGPIQLKLDIHPGRYAHILVSEFDDWRFPPQVFLAPDGMGGQQIGELFEQVTLTSEESQIIKALQEIDPSIERFAVLSKDNPKAFVRCKGIEQRIPLGSLGDGVWRMLSLALAFTDVKGGVLLLDEIDTGLHYSVMEKMWKLVYATAKRLNVQVFATTHSNDCLHALAAIAETEAEEGEEVTVHRINREKEHSVAFTGSQILAIAERGGEIR